ncbi:hypothetical protein rosag_47060 [Roseisolibacter agri]|uniref:Uncharacterized protein n=1 Tax=Roseisolibacter agri TaxID=2014610 RepID=A0AA37QLT1_9BACT|nr:hypothetical protein rosag_47060 [Roseisolibacter agri]
MLCRGLPGPQATVLPPPVCDDVTCVGQVEDALVFQALVAQSAAEAPHAAMVNRRTSTPARSDGAEGERVCSRPLRNARLENAEP